MRFRKPVVQTVANLKTIKTTPEAAATKARGVILDWLHKKQKVQLPPHAFAGSEFEIDAAEGQPCMACVFDRLWSVQLDRSDPIVPERIWRTEASVGYSNDAALVGVRLAVIDPAQSTGHPVTVPRVIGDLIRSAGLHAYGVPLLDSAVAIRSKDDFNRFVGLLQNPDRTRPVLVFSEEETEDSDVGPDADLAAERLAGLAHVYILPAHDSWTLTEKVGREFSVWRGAVRTYQPGFNPLVDEVNAHPVATRPWIEQRFGSMGRFVDAVAISTAARTARDSALEQLLPSFRVIKTASVQKRIAALSKGAAAVTNERELLLEKENALLRQQIAEKTDEYLWADAEVQQAELERDQYRAQLSAQGVRVDFLEAELGKKATTVDYPDSLDGIDDWCEKHFPGRMLLLNRAARAARKSPYNDPRLVYQCLERLGRQYVDGRRGGNLSDGLFDDLGVHLALTGDPATLSQWKSEYFVTHRGRSQFLEWHLTKGSDKNETNTLRIYFFYDDDDRQVVVGHLPGHLTNTKS